MAKQVLKSNKKYTPEQYCPICQVGHDKTYDQKIVKIHDSFNGSKKTDKNRKDYEEKLEKTVRGHTVLTLQRSDRGINTLVCQASVEQIHKIMQHYSTPHFEKFL